MCQNNIPLQHKSNQTFGAAVTASINFGFHSLPVIAVKRFFVSNSFATSASMVA
jgi:hypothetical protein